MTKNSAIALMLMLTGLAGYLLLDSMGIGGGFLMAGLLYMGLGRKHFAGVCQAECQSGSKRIRINRGRPRRTAKILEKRVCLEALRTRAHLLAGACRDTYGTQQCCLAIISQTEKEDPLFLEACDLYMRTLSTPSPRLSDPRTPSDSTQCQVGQKQVPVTANVIPFPLTAERN
jgi:hypothetical protein